MSQLRVVDDPAWRVARARKAGAANRQRCEAARLALGDQYPSKGHAYAAGYRVGYQAAMRWWLRKHQAALRTLKARDEA